MAAHAGFDLIIDPSNMDYYGDVPCTPVEKDGTYEEYVIDWDDMLMLCEDFRDPINELCDTWLDLGDVDYFDAEKRCPLLRGWLIERLEQPCTPRLREMYEVLLDYTIRAIELGTGVVVDL